MNHKQDLRMAKFLFITFSFFYLLNTVKDISIIADQHKRQTVKKEYIIVKQEVQIKSPRFEQMEITAYTAGYESTQKRKGQKGYGITASGTTVKEGRTAACPKSLPFGTEIFIPELNRVYICEDRGGAIKEGKIDIFINDLNKAINFGRKKMDVLINIRRSNDAR